MYIKTQNTEKQNKLACDSIKSVVVLFYLIKKSKNRKMHRAVKKEKEKEKRKMSKKISKKQQKKDVKTRFENRKQTLCKQWQTLQNKKQKKEITKANKRHKHDTNQTNSCNSQANIVTTKKIAKNTIRRYCAMTIFANSNNNLWQTSGK